MLLLLYKPKDNIINHRDLLVNSDEAHYLQDFPGSICVSHDTKDSFCNNINAKCYNGMLRRYLIRGWLVPKNNSNFIILKHETINI